MLTPHIMPEGSENRRHVLKMMGNIVVPGRHIEKIFLDKKFQAEYNKQLAKFSSNAESTADTNL